MAQFIWSLTYLYASVGIARSWSVAKPLVLKSQTLWAFVLLMFVSIAWSVEPVVTFYNAIELIGTTLVALYIVVRFTLREMLVLVAVTFVAIALLSLGFVFGAPGHGRMNYGSGAWSGVYQEKNNLGAAMSLAAISLAALVADARGRGRLVAIAAAGLCIALLIGSNSATALIDCVAAITVLFAALACRSSRFGVPARVVSLGLVTGIALLVTVFGVTQETLVAAFGRDPNLTGRTDFWPYLLSAIGDRPLAGFGYNAFFRSTVGADYLSTYVVQAGGWTPYHAHNSFLQIALDAGIVGLVLLAILLATILVRGVIFLGRDRHGYASWPIAITAYLLMGSLTETYLANYNTFEWIVFVAALLYPLRARSKEPSR